MFCTSRTFSVTFKAKWGFPSTITYRWAFGRCASRCSSISSTSSGRGSRSDCRIVDAKVRPMPAPWGSSPFSRPWRSCRCSYGTETTTMTCGSSAFSACFFWGPRRGGPWMDASRQPCFGSMSRPSPPGSSCGSFRQAGRTISRSDSWRHSRRAFRLTSQVAWDGWEAGSMSVYCSILGAFHTACT